ncbi:hypothetical protein BY458DRAFT_498550, partial [Sporodiniella umbellata]
MSQTKRSRAVSSESLYYKKICSNNHSQNEDIANSEQSLPLKFYFSLALVLSDGYKPELLRSEDAHISLLYEHAYVLFNDKERLQKTAEKLLGMDGDHVTFNSVHFNKERDYLFIVSTLKCLHDKESKTFELLEKLNIYENVLQQLLFENIKFARLLPLIHLLYYSNELEIVSSPEVFYITDEEELKNENSESSVYDMSQNVFLLEDDNPINLPKQKTEVDEGKPTEEQFSVLDDKPESNKLESNKTQSANVKPNYLDLTLPELKALLKKYGYKGSNSRKQIIEKLDNIWSSVSTVAPQVQPYNPPSEVKANIVRCVKLGNPEMWSKMVNYQQVDLDECSQKLNCKKSELRPFLDEHGCLTSNKAPKNKKK